MIRKLTIGRKHWREMLHHVAQHVPLEACGLLAGKSGRVEKVIIVQNQARSPVRFVMDPYEQLRAFEWIETNGLDLLGIFHSHPTGPETASVTDIAEATYEVVHVIWSFKEGTWTARSFWIENGRMSDVALLVREE